MSDFTNLTISGTLDGAISFRQCQIKDGLIEEIALFTLKSDLDLGDRQVEIKTSVLARGADTLDWLRSKAPSAGDAVIINGGVAYPGTDGSLCCRVNTPAQVHIPEKTNGLDNGPFCSAEAFFLENGCSVNGKTKDMGT